MGFYSLNPLSPGGWTELLDEAGLPHRLRRLNEPIVLGTRTRSTDFRCLAMLPALAYLLGDHPNETSASLRAWKLAARVIEKSIAGGGELPDLSRFAGAFPPAAHAVGVVDENDEDEGLISMDSLSAVTMFVEATMRALAAAVREPKILTSPDVHPIELDLSRLQPSLRAVAPELGAVAPVVQLRDTLDLELTLELPVGDGDAWPLRAEPADPGLLKRAAHIFPPLGDMAGGLVELSLDSVWELRLAGSALEFSGVKLNLPPEISESSDLQIEDAELVLLDGPLSVGGTVQFDLTASLGGKEISRDEFRELARSSQPLVRLGGEWRALSSKSLLKAKSMAAVALHGSSLPALTALGATLGGISDLRGVGVSVAATEGSELARLANEVSSPEMRTAVDAPEGFQGTLRPYQHVGLGWLQKMRKLGMGALLADDMGLGKTVQLIAYLVDRSDDFAGSALIVAPTSVLGNWEREVHRFAPDLDVHIHHGPDRTSSAEELTRHDVVLTSYALLARDRKLLTGPGWRTLVLDEAQAVKNPLTRAAQTARAITAHHRVALTGTPVENRLDELWSIMQILNPGLLGTRTGFRRTLATPIERHSDAEAEARLKRITGPFLLRRRKTDPEILPDLPPRQDSTEFCTLTLEQAGLYQATIDTIMGGVQESEGIARRGRVLALITRLKQVCNHPVHAMGKPGALGGRSGKLDRMTEMLTEVVEEGENALVFTQFAVMGRMIADHLERELQLERLYLDGSLTRDARERVVDKFQGGTQPRVLVASLRAGGTGLNLTAASHVFHFDRWWNPAVEDQASDRAHRIGQTRVVQVHRLVCAGTIEERIDQLIADKRDLATRIVDKGVDSVISELSDTELEDLVRLRQ